ncbi:unnamed protein product [Adineta steineri]|uniref:G-protein coupled receptors family 1 profile domain-containing protein n=1 Tax=Adineta steineri TaxID=433720 RepID=A0A815DJP3_9BILA|nr:unnamed protein product [Adineta steineri]
MSTLSCVQIITIVSQQFIIYSSFIILILGLVGNILNIITFTSLRIFRNNQCIFYIIVASIVDCGTLLIEFITRIQLNIYGYDLTNISLVWCKIRPMIFHTCMMISLTTVCFSSFDQYLSTSHYYRLRQMSSLKLSKRLTFINISFWIIYSIPFGIFYEITSVTGCTILNQGFKFYFSFVHLSILNGVIPLITASVFSILSYRNVRHIIRLQIPIVRRRLDRQLTAMVLIRVLYLFIVSIPFGLFFIYTLNTSNNTNDSLRIAVEQLITNITSTFYYLNYAGSFYLYCFASNRFRRQKNYLLFKKIWQKCYVKILFKTTVQRNQIVPVSQISNFK